MPIVIIRLIVPLVGVIAITSFLGCVSLVHSFSLDVVHVLMLLIVQYYLVPAIIWKQIKYLLAAIAQFLDVILVLLMLQLLTSTVLLA